MRRAEVPWESVLTSLTDVSLDNKDDSNILRLCLIMTPFSLSQDRTSEGCHLTHICWVRTGERDKLIGCMAKILALAAKRQAADSLVML